MGKLPTCVHSYIQDIGVGMDLKVEEMGNKLSKQTTKKDVWRQS
jgi:hypothetical protein